MNFRGRRYLRFAPAWTALLLAACSDLHASLADAEGGRDVCVPVPAPRRESAANAYQQAIQRDECLHRWAYRLSRAPDLAESVAAAAVAACRTEIDRSATLLGEGDEEAERFYLEQMERAARERALFRVIQARAGDCS